MVVWMTTVELDCQGRSMWVPRRYNRASGILWAGTAVVCSSGSVKTVLRGLRSTRFGGYLEHVWMTEVALDGQGQSVCTSRRHRRVCGILWARTVVVCSSAVVETVLRALRRACSGAGVEGGA